MHNCKLTRSSFIDLSLDEISPARTTQLLAELNGCPACREEYAALRSALHLSSQALRSSLPGEEFWTGYRARLNAKLLIQSNSENSTGDSFSSAQPAQTPVRSGLWLGLRRMVTASVRVPVPAALGLMLLFGGSFFVLRSRGPANAIPPPQLPTVETKTVTVPVIQERVVTRVVYVEKKGRSRRAVNDPGRSENPTLSDSVARASSDTSARAAMSLTGFKPTDQIKLTITKGSYRDEK